MLTIISIGFSARTKHKPTLCRKSSDKSSSEPSRISTVSMQRLVEQLRNKQVRPSTDENYQRIWKQFNQFLVKLDKLPKYWEDRATLFAAYLIDKGSQSSTIKSYMSAIKSILILDNYNWCEEKFMVHALTKACKLENDCVKARFPIHLSLLEMLLFEIDRYFDGKQIYLQCMYKAMFAISYYGLLRVGEVTSSEHVIKAKDIKVGKNKDKLLIYLYSSKTHHQGSRPQKIKIMSNKVAVGEIKGKPIKFRNRHFCPFHLISNFIKMRGTEPVTPTEQFFVFRDKSPVKPDHVRSLLKTLLKRIALDPSLYDFHSFRVGRSSDMIKFGFTMEEIKRIGHWKSNAVYKYIKL